MELIKPQISDFEILWNEFCDDFIRFYNRFVIRNLHKFEYAIIRRISKGILEIHGHIDFDAVKVEEIFSGIPGYCFSFKRLMYNNQLVIFFEKNNLHPIQMRMQAEPAPFF